MLFRSTGTWSDRLTVVLVQGEKQTTLVSTTVSSSGAALAVGASAGRQYAFRLPDGSAGVGTLKVTVTTDAGGAVFESNAANTGETNNVATAQVDTKLADYPDLVVGGLQVFRGDAADAAASFSTTTNGLGPWRYGSMSTDYGAFTPFAAYAAPLFFGTPTWANSFDGAHLWKSAAAAEGEIGRAHV